VRTTPLESLSGGGQGPASESSRSRCQRRAWAARPASGDDATSQGTNEATTRSRRIGWRGDGRAHQRRICRPREDHVCDGDKIDTHSVCMKVRDRRHTLAHADAVSDDGRDGRASPAHIGDLDRRRLRTNDNRHLAGWPDTREAGEGSLVHGQRLALRLRQQW